MRGGFLTSLRAHARWSFLKYARSKVRCMRTLNARASGALNDRQIIVNCGMIMHASQRNNTRCSRRGDNLAYFVALCTWHASNARHVQEETQAGTSGVVTSWAKRSKWTRNPIDCKPLRHMKRYKVSKVLRDASAKLCLHALFDVRCDCDSTRE